MSQQQVGTKSRSPIHGDEPVIHMIYLSKYLPTKRKCIDALPDLKSMAQ